MEGEDGEVESDGSIGEDGEGLGDQADDELGPQDPGEHGEDAQDGCVGQRRVESDASVGVGVADEADEQHGWGQQDEDDGECGGAGLQDAHGCLHCSGYGWSTEVAVAVAPMGISSTPTTVSRAGR